MMVRRKNDEAPRATLNVRGIAPDVAAAIRASAKARGVTIAGYLTALAELHEDMRREEAESPRVRGLLAAHRLHSITV